MRQTFCIVGSLLLFMAGSVRAQDGGGGDEPMVPVADKPEKVAPSIFVEQQTDCMSIDDIKASLHAVLDAREEASFMIVTVVVTPAVDGYLGVLRAIDRKTGEILLERTLSIAEEECGDAHRVLRVMLEQFLTGFPIEKWKERQVETPSPDSDRSVEQPAAAKEAAFLRWMMLMGLDSRWPTPNGDVEISFGVDAGAARHGIIGQAVVRGGWPRVLGEGRYLETTALMALGWRFTPNRRLMLRTELRVGTTRVSGLGYERNYHQWLVMLELQLSILWRVGAVYLGPEAAVSPLFHTVHNRAGDSEDVPWIRVGLVLGIPLGKNVIK